MADFWKLWDRLRLRAVTADPSSLADGESWYNSTGAKFKFRQGGSTIELPTFSSPARYTTNSAQSIPTSADTTINFEDIDYDPSSLVTIGASWIWTSPGTGKARVNARITFGDTFNNSDVLSIYIYKNASEVARLNYRIDTTAAQNQTIQISDLITVVATDTIHIKASQNSGANKVLTTASQGNAVSIRLE